MNLLYNSNEGRMTATHIQNEQIFNTLFRGIAMFGYISDFDAKQFDKYSEHIELTSCGHSIVDFYANSTHIGEYQWHLNKH